MKAIKRPLPVQVTFAVAGGTLDTLEGPVAYTSGDAILTGIKGEHWPMHRVDFAERYEPCEGQVMFADGVYVKRRAIVEAEQLDAPLAICIAGRGQLQGRLGDWLITGADGDQWIVGADIFIETYELQSDADSA